MPTHPLLAVARTEGNPVIQSDGAIFLWQGKTAPLLIDDSHNWEDDPQVMERAGSDLWSLSLPLASDAYLEYAFLDPDTGERLSDPLNQNHSWNGINAYNHYFYMPKASPSPLVQRGRGTRKGTLTRHQVATREFASGSTRTVYLYQPAVNTPVPLLVVFDGLDYLKRGRLNVIVDNLIAAQSIRPIAMAMVKNGGPHRSLEYSCSESTLGFLMECLIPFARENLNLTPPGSEPYGVMGASLGGTMALYTGLRLPQIFGKVLSQSGAFITPEHQFVVADLVKYAPPPGIVIWMDIGRYDSLLDGNRQLYALLKEKDYRATYHEFSGGHNYTSWRNDIWQGLEILFQ